MPLYPNAIVMNYPARCWEIPFSGSCKQQSVTKPRLSAQGKTTDFAHVALENPVHDVATNRGTSSKNGCVAHLLAEFLAILLEFARLFAINGSHSIAGLADFERKVPITADMWRHSLRPLLFYDVDIAPGKDALESCSFISTSPPFKKYAVSLVDGGLLMSCSKFFSRAKKQLTVIVHMLGDLYPIALLQGQITSICWSIRIKSACKRENLWAGCIGRWRWSRDRERGVMTLLNVQIGIRRWLCRALDG